MQNLEFIIESVPFAFALIFALYFYLHKGGKNNSNAFLGLFFIAFACVQFFLVFSDLTNESIGKLLLPFIVGGSLIIPPSMYIYVNSLTLNVKRLNIKKNLSIGIFFFIVNVIAYSTVNIFKDVKDILSLIVPLLNVTTLLPIIVLFPISSLYYIYKSFKSIAKHQKDIGEVFSYEKGINLQWVKIFLIGFICWFIAVVLDGFVNYGSIEEQNFIRKHTYDFVTTSYLIFVGLKAFQQSTIDKALINSQVFIKEEIEEDKLGTIENEFEQDKFSEIWMKCEKIINDKSPYTNVNLTIYDLAKMAETNYKYLSKAINQNSNQNFVSYINSYRVKEAMLLLKNNNYDNYTIEAIAEMSGFKSKSAFNTAFKKNTGKTPSEFKNA